MKKYPNLYVRIWKVVKTIPKGHVATYGQIANLCDLRGHARLIGYALHNLKPNSACGKEPSADASGVPWHRVINSRGTISFPKHTADYKSQKKLLEREGVAFNNDKIDLIKYGAGISAERKKGRGR